MLGLEEPLLQPIKYAVVLDMIKKAIRIFEYKDIDSLFKEIVSMKKGFVIHRIYQEKPSYAEVQKIRSILFDKNPLHLSPS